MVFKRKNRLTGKNNQKPVKDEFSNIFCECASTGATEIASNIMGGNSGMFDGHGSRCICTLIKDFDNAKGKRVSVESVAIDQTNNGNDPQRDGTFSANLED